jgi:hypothetical protein
MKTCQISGVEMDRLKILYYYALHLSYRQALDVKKIEEVVSGGKTGEMEAGRIHPSRRSFRLKKKTKDVTFQTGNYR